MADAIGYVDLKLMCRCMARAVNKHIDFSKGFLFQDELKELEMTGVEDFSYALQSNLKIDLDKYDEDRLKVKQEQSEEGKEKNEETYANLKALIK